MVENKQADTDTQRIREIHIYLPEEGTDTWRPTQAVDLGNGLFKVLSTSDYDPENEVWEFLPGSIVRIEQKMLYEGINPVALWVAVKA